MGKALRTYDRCILHMKSLIYDSSEINHELTVQISSHLCIQSALICKSSQPHEGGCS